MIRVNQIKVGMEGTAKDIKKKTAEFLRISEKDILELNIVRQSIDARKKPTIFYTYSVDIAVKDEARILKRFTNKENLVSKSSTKPYKLPECGTEKLSAPIVVIGMGPAGLFCAYYLACKGFRPILLERGKCVQERQRDVENYWQTGVLNTASNVQFGEGGAGTFSDGKLNTLVKDKYGRNLEVLNTLVKFGAKKSITYEAKPHIGTDVLSRVVESMRNEIIRLGGEVHFSSQVTDLKISDGKLQAVIVNDSNEIRCQAAVLAIGHSARDTFYMLYEKKLQMEAKPFAVGLRVEHPQDMINESQYGMKNPGSLGAAPYKVTAQAANGRGVYSFCMCPGGYVVNASSEEGRIAVNGMSYSGRNGRNANSAIIVSVTPEDFPSEHPLSGIEFQRELEAKAYAIGNGKIPVQRYGAFKAIVEQREDIPVFEEEELIPQTKGGYTWADVTKIMPKACNEAFVDGMTQFGRQIHEFDREDAVLLGVESRTSSPVKIFRDDYLQANIAGIYPCGEGAGYAGGITSAAMDGLCVAEELISKYHPEMM